MRRRVEVLLLFGVLALAGGLRLINGAINPGWYTDEATHLEIARHLVEGRVQYFALGQSTLLVARLPLFELVLAGVGRLAGVTIGTLRTLTGSLGVLTIGLLYAVTRRMTRQPGFALAAALTLAVYPQAVIYSRFGFSYGLLAPLVLLIVWGVWEVLEAGEERHWRWVVLAGGAAGVGLVSDVLMLSFAAVLLLVLALHRWQDGLLAAGIMALPVGLAGVLMLSAAPDAMLFDLGYTLGRMGPASGGGWATLAGNLRVLLGDAWLFGGAIGLLFVPLGRLRWLALLFAGLPVAIIGRTVALHSLSAYYLIPVLPLVALGMAALIWRSVEHLTAAVQAAWDELAGPVGWLSGDRLARGLAVLVLAGALWLVVPPQVRAVQVGFLTSIDPFLIDATAARTAAAFVNDTLPAGETVIASPPVGWLVDGQVADFQMAVAAAGDTTPHLPPDMPPQRWRFDPRFERARYLVVDDLWRRWGAVHIPGVAQAVAAAQSDWRLVFESGTIAVYENPALAR